MEGSVTQDAAGRRNHSEEGRKDRLRFLQLVELDECVEKGDSDEDTTEISVLYVTLVEVMSMGAKDRKLVKAHVKVDAKEDVLEKTRNDQNDVEHGLETVQVLRSDQKAKSHRITVYTNLLESRLLLGRSEGVRSIALKTRFCLGGRKTARLGRIVPGKGRVEQALNVGNG